MQFAWPLNVPDLGVLLAAIHVIGPVIRRLVHTCYASNDMYMYIVIAMIAEGSKAGFRN